MTDHRPSILPAKGRTIVCIASYFKGNQLLEQCKREGCHVILVTLEPLLNKPWAREFIDEVFAVHSLTDRRGVINAISYLARTRDIARIIDSVKREKVAAVFLENIADPRLAESIAAQTGAKIGGTLYSDALSDAKGPAPNYIEMVRHNVKELTEALGGAR